MSCRCHQILELVECTHLIECIKFAEYIEHVTSVLSVKLVILQLELIAKGTFYVHVLIETNNFVHWLCKKQRNKAFSMPKIL